MAEPIIATQVAVRQAEGGVLHAPYERQMLERVGEAMDSDIDLRLSSRASDETLLEGHGRHACLEVQGDLPSILDA